MKRICLLILLLAVIASLGACGNDTITMKDVYNAGLSKYLLENNESIYVPYVVNGEAYGESYVHKDYVYTNINGVLTLVTDQAYYIQQNDSCERLLLMSKDGLADIASFRAENYVSVFFDQETTREEIQSVTQEDNLITVKSFSPEKRIKHLAQEQEGLTSANFEYVLDATTHNLLFSKNVYNYEDGSVLEIVSDAIYNAEPPEAAQAILAYDSQTEDLRTVTIVTNPGTKNEKTESVQIPKGMPVLMAAVSVRLGNFGIYSDAACTQQHTTPDGHNSDVTVYVKWDN